MGCLSLQRHLDNSGLNDGIALIGEDIGVFYKGEKRRHLSTT